MLSLSPSRGSVRCFFRLRKDSNKKRKAAWWEDRKKQRKAGHETQIKPWVKTLNPKP